MKTILLALSIVGSLATSTFAQGTKDRKPPEMTTEQRQKMADVHEKMAACLRSDRPLADCRDEMMKSCQENMGGTCPMMPGMKCGGRKMQPAPTK